MGILFLLSSIQKDVVNMFVSSEMFHDHLSSALGHISSLAELTGRAILIGDQTSDTHVTAKLEPWQTYFHETVTN